MAERILDNRKYESDFEEVAPKPVEVLEEFQIEEELPAMNQIEAQTEAPMSVVRRTRVVDPESKHGSTLNSIRTRFEMARATGPTTVAAKDAKTVARPARREFSAELAKLNSDLAATDVPEVEVGGISFDAEADQIMAACASRYTAGKHSWVREAAIEVSKPQESVEALYAAALKVLPNLPKRIITLLFLVLCLAAGTFAQAPQGAGATDGPLLRRPHPHVRLHHRHHQQNANRLPMRARHHRRA
jgi:hypothetical protein